MGLETKEPVLSELRKGLSSNHVTGEFIEKDLVSAENGQGSDKVE